MRKKEYQEFEIDKYEYCLAILYDPKLDLKRTKIERVGRFASVTLVYKKGVK